MVRITLPIVNDQRQMMRRDCSDNVVTACFHSCNGGCGAEMLKYDPEARETLSKVFQDRQESLLSGHDGDIASGRTFTI